MLRVAGFDYLDMADTDGIAMAIFFQGCGHHCKGCHNPELQVLGKGGTLYVEDILVEHVVENMDGLDYLVLSGGDPLFQNHRELYTFMLRLKALGIEMWMYTGFDYDEVPDWCKQMCHCIKCGRYAPEAYPPQEGDRLASRNQAFYFRDGRVEH